MSQSPMRIAFQGVFGAFSHEACRAALPDAEPIAFRSFEAAFAAVADGDCAMAFIPVDNSTAGPVPDVAALLPISGLEAVAEHLWPIHLQLMAAPGVAMTDVEEVASHPMALKQCAAFLSRAGLRAMPAFDTAGAAAELAHSKTPHRAVVAARAAAEIYGLSILRENVEDRPDNTTRFLVLRRPAASGV